MARKTAKAEAEVLMARFFKETENKYIIDVRSTRQPTRRAVLLAEMDALDKVKGRFYAWLTDLDIAV